LRALVLDGSTTLGFLLDDEKFAAALRALESIEKGMPAYVPVHWWLETVNGLIKCERRRRLSQIKIAATLNALHALPVITDEQTAARCTGETAALARQYALTIYDAAYLELAIRRGASLATADRELAKAARAAGVKVLD
jgi:predicted nucleic acid-binding protein